MKNKIYKKKIGNKELIIEFKNLAEQTNGNIFVRLGDTLVLTTAVMSKEEKLNYDFFPLTVEYEEKYYAAGKIKGSRYIKRESRPSDEAICNARLIDRAIRPRFPENLFREVQVITAVLSWDAENDPDVLGLIAASLSLSISDIPFNGPVSAVRVCYKNDKFILNPTYQEREDSVLDVVFAAILKNDELLINMIEGGFEEAEEDLVFKAFEFAEESLKELISFQNEIIKDIGKEKIILPKIEIDFQFESQVKNFLNQKLEEAIYKKDKKERDENLNLLKKDLFSFIDENFKEDENAYKNAQIILEKEINRIIHENIIKYEKRPDGRKINELREIYCEANILPRTHGSGLFCREMTKSLSILTLGSPNDQQLLEGMEIVGKKRFMHHYNFPPYCSGEIKPLRGPGRREIGHGALAEKALLPLIPSYEEFPYTIRIVSEILSSNGSTSMASVCSSSLSLMDAGVPIKRPVAGISSGLMQDENGNYKILTDIQGPEDHYGDMDFKVARTEKGITAIQLDVKIDGINKKIFKETLDRAKIAILEILEKIKKVLDKPRENLSPYAPRILKIQIDPNKIKDVIGPGGKIINEIIEKTSTTIDIEDSGLIFVTSEKEESAQKAIEWIKNITREVAVGEIFKGKVKRILDFGAFVEILPGQEGLIHISKMAPYRIKKVEDVLNVGDIVEVKVISIDEQGRINLSLIKNDNK